MIKIPKLVCNHITLLASWEYIDSAIWLPILQIFFLKESKSIECNLSVYITLMG